ncbi:MAG TPA: VCBS repeat-containing protein [Thermoanaerobaculia bacterium]|nr:VCBS repeat-containing protein [Thermoanaerobaculia bacterium]
MRDRRTLLLLLLLVVCSPLLHAECPAFAAQAPLLSGAGNPIHLLPSDLNKDGLLDLVAFGQDSVAFQLGRGDGTFVAPGAVYPTGTGAWDKASGDLNLDGNEDFVVANLGDSSISVFLTRGDGTAITSVFPTITQPFAVAVADVTSDGNPDVLVGSFNYGLVVHTGDGKGAFSFQTIRAVPNVNTALAFVPHDLNGDGKLDLVVSLYETASLGTFFGKGDGTFTTGPSISTTATGGTRSLLLADLDHDGRLDAVHGTASNFGVEVFHGNGDGSFRRGGSFGAGDVSWALIASDLTNDGNLDLLVTTRYQTGVRMLIGTGGGQFAPLRFLQPSLFAYGLAAGDFDGDGRNDIIVSDHESSTITVLRNTSDCSAPASSKRRSIRH